MEVSPDVEAAAVPPAPTGAGPVLEQYKLAVEMADRVSARRATANAFFFTLNSALIALVGLVHAGQPEGVQLSTDRFGAAVLSLAGLAVSLTWLLLLRAYRQLNWAKWNVINALEHRLPVQPFKDEWDLLKSAAPVPWWRSYRDLGAAERVVPVMYAALYVLAFVRALVG